jgi:hypothetical protein
MPLFLQVQQIRPWNNFILLLDQKFSLRKYYINNTRFIGLEVCTVRKQTIWTELSTIVSCPCNHAMKTYWGSESIAPRILNLGTKWSWVVSFMPRPSYSGEGHRYQQGRRRGGPQSHSGHGGEKKIRTPAGNRTLGVQPAAAPNNCMWITWFGAHKPWVTWCENWTLLIS